MARKKKKHICAECGEEFKHGIGLRKHQRQTGHKGSRIEEVGAPPPPPPAEEPPAAEAAPVVEPAPAEEPPPKPRRRSRRSQEAAPEPEPVVDEPVAAELPEPEEDDRTVAVSRPSAPDQTMAVPRPTQAVMPQQQVGPGPTKMQHTKQKLNLVSRGLKVVLSHRAKGAGQQLKRSAKSGADIFKEALKLAIALTCFLAIPTIMFLWWKSGQVPEHRDQQPAVFSFDDGALAARSTLLLYLDHLRRQNWQDAYTLLSPQWQRQLSREEFQDAFLDIEGVKWAVSDQRLNPDGGADVLVRLAFREGGKDRQFVGRFRLLKSTQGWRIDRAELSPDRSS